MHCVCLSLQQKTTAYSSHLYVSHARGPFKRAYFPNNAHPLVRYFRRHVWSFEKCKRCSIWNIVLCGKLFYLKYSFFVEHRSMWNRIVCGILFYVEYSYV